MSVPLDYSTNLLGRNHSEIYWRDPYLAWIIVNKLESIPQWQLEALDLASPDQIQEAASYYLGNSIWNQGITDTCANAVKLSHSDASFAQVQDAVRFGYLYRESLLLQSHQTWSARGISPGRARWSLRDRQLRSWTSTFPRRTPYLIASLLCQKSP